MTGAHTRGPWVLSGDLEPMGNCLSRSLIGEDSFVAEILYDDEEDPTADANGRLIKAAPDMLGALIAVRARFQHYRHGPDEEMVMDRVQAAIDLARASPTPLPSGSIER